MITMKFFTGIFIFFLCVTIGYSKPSWSNCGTGNCNPIVSSGCSSGGCQTPVVQQVIAQPAPQISSGCGYGGCQTPIVQQYVPPPSSQVIAQPAPQISSGCGYGGCQTPIVQQYVPPPLSRVIAQPAPQISSGCGYGGCQTPIVQQYVPPSSSQVIVQPSPSPSQYSSSCGPSMVQCPRTTCGIQGCSTAIACQSSCNQPTYVTQPTAPVYLQQPSPQQQYTSTCGPSMVQCPQTSCSIRGCSTATTCQPSCNQPKYVVQQAPPAPVYAPQQPCQQTGSCG